MKWEKLGLVFRPSGENESLQSHGSMPLSYHIGGDRFRFYFSSRDSNNSSAINYVEVNIDKPSEILFLSNEPVLRKGPYGHFDDNGLYSGSLIKYRDKLYMFYSGRSNGVDNLYYMNIGLAVSENNGLKFKRVMNHPILSRSEYDPWLVTAPSVYEKDKVFNMIYTSGTKIFNDGTSNYDLKLAKSDDFYNWKSTGEKVISLEKGESNISAPCVVKYGDKFHIWFSIKPNKGEYRIGYASSVDGNTWHRDDNCMGLNIGESKFDNQAVSYPNLFCHKNFIYMLYSGNNNGLEGFGIARTELTNLI